MRTTTVGLAFLGFTALTLPAAAATTANDAAKVQATLSAYLGSAAGAVTVTPDGDGFKTVLDLNSLMAKAKVNGAEMTVTPLEVNLTPEGNGKWKVKREGPLAITSKVPGEFTLNENFETYNIIGEYDESLAAFSTVDVSAKNITFTEEMTGKTGTPVKADGKFDSISATGTATANPAGGVDIKFTEPFGPAILNETIGGKDDNPMNLQFKIASGNFDGSLTGTKSASLLELLKFVVAHQDKDAMVKDQAGFKNLLNMLLPVFANITGTGNVNKLEVQTPMGLASAEKVGFGTSLNGLVKDGKLTETFNVEGLVLPPGLAPSWASSLLPKNVSLSTTVAGYDAETVAKAAIAAMDLSKDPSVPKDVSDGLADLLLPKGTVDVSFEKTSINNDTYNISAEGNFQAGPAAMPSGKAHITAKGLDDIMKVVQASPPEAGLQAGTAVIIAAKGMAKAETDGSLSWDVQATADGKLLVNGVDVSKLAK